MYNSKKINIHFDLNKNSLQNILEHEFWETELRQFKWQECREKCSNKVVNQDYATSW